MPKASKRVNNNSNTIIDNQKPLLLSTSSVTSTSIITPSSLPSSSSLLSHSSSSSSSTLVSSPSYYQNQEYNGSDSTVTTNSMDTSHNDVTATTSILATSSATGTTSTTTASSSSPSPSSTLPNKRTKWILCSRISLIILYVLIVCLIGVVIWQLVIRGSERHVIAWAVGAMAVGIAVPLSLHDIHLHILHYVNPLQRYYIRILWMVPIYAIESWVALRYKDQAVYLSTLREAYEAFVVYSATKLMMDYVGPSAVAQLKVKGHTHVHMIPPLCYVRPWPIEKLYNKVNLLIFQYVFLRTILAIAILIAEHYDTYGEGDWHAFDKLYIWTVIIINFSQFGAMYGLVLFYHELKDELKPLGMLNKLLAVKGVVFVSFWQSILISGLVSLHVIEGTFTYTEDEVAAGLQNFLICLEMIAAAFCHRYVFSFVDFQNENAVVSPITQALVDMMPHDLIREAGSHVKHGVEAIKIEKLPWKKRPWLVGLKVMKTRLSKVVNWFYG